jgi:hypothetical protein
MAEVRRVSPAEARQRVASGALFVCTYESEELCRRNRLEGGMSLQEFQSRYPSLDKGKEIVFYCA